MLPSVAGYSFGAFAPDTSKTTSGNTSFRLALLNPGAETLEVDLDSRGLENGDVALPDTVSLPPSETSSTSSNGSVSIAPGTYVEPTWVEFHVVTDDYSDPDFSVIAEARRASLSSEQTVSPETVQVREFAYTLDYPEQRFPESEGEQTERSTDIFSFGEESPERNKSAETNQTMLFGGEEKTEVKRSGSNLPTGILALVAALSLVYLWRSL